MITVNFDFVVFFRLLLYVFLPVTLAVAMMWVGLTIYYSKKKDDVTKDYARRGSVLSLFMSSVITLVLLIVNILFTISFINSLKTNNLVDGNKLVYYVVLFSPLIPLICFIVYVVGMIKNMKKKEDNVEKIEDKEEKLIKEIKNDNENEDENNNDEDEDEVEVL